MKIPTNLFIIGTMNSSDHSIKVLDHAIRRRFNFVSVNPNNKVLENWLRENSISIDVEYAENCVKLFDKVNDRILDLKARP